MEPTNLKHLFHILMDSIDQVRSGEMKSVQAKSISDLAARVNTTYQCNLNRERLVMEIENHKMRIPGSAANLRNIEGKNFD